MDKAKLLHYAPGSLVAIEIPFEVGCEVQFQQIVQKLKPVSGVETQAMDIASPDRPAMPGFPVGGAGMGGMEILPTKRKSHYDNIVEKLERKYVTHAYNPTESPEFVNPATIDGDDDDSSADDDGDGDGDGDGASSSSDAHTCSISGSQKSAATLNNNNKKRTSNSRNRNPKRRFIEYYDDADGFIDDEEALESAEQAIRMTTTRTKHSGFFVSSGVLETVKSTSATTGATTVATATATATADREKGQTAVTKRKRDRSNDSGATTGTGNSNNNSNSAKQGPPAKKKREKDLSVSTVAAAATTTVIAVPASPQPQRPTSSSPTATTAAITSSLIPSHIKDQPAVPSVSEAEAQASIGSATATAAIPAGTVPGSPTPTPSCAPLRSSKSEVPAAEIIAQWQRSEQVRASLETFREACTAHFNGEPKPTALKPSHPFPRHLDAALEQLDACIDQHDKKAMNSTAYYLCISAALGDVLTVNKIKSSLKRVRARRVVEQCKAAILSDLVPLTHFIRASVVDIPTPTPISSIVAPVAATALTSTAHVAVASGATDDANGGDGTAATPASATAVDVDIGADNTLLPVVPAPAAASAPAPFKWKVKWSIEMKTLLLALENSCAEWYSADATYRRTLTTDDTKYETQQEQLLQQQEEAVSTTAATTATVDSSNTAAAAALKDAWATSGIAFRKLSSEHVKEKDAFLDIVLRNICYNSNSNSGSSSNVTSTSCALLNIPALYPNKDTCGQFADPAGVRKLITLEKGRLKKKARALEGPPVDTGGDAAGVTPALIVGGVGGVSGSIGGDKPGIEPDKSLMSAASATAISPISLQPLPPLATTAAASNVSPPQLVER